MDTARVCMRVCTEGATGTLTGSDAPMHSISRIESFRGTGTGGLEVLGGVATCVGQLKRFYRPGRL